MKSLDLWLVGFGLRCCALLVAELACFGFVVPTLFDLHRDAADVFAAMIVIVALAGGFLAGMALTRELTALVSDPNSDSNSDKDHE